MSRFNYKKPLIHRIRDHLRTLMNKRLFHFVLWWRRGESNPCPNMLPPRPLRAQLMFLTSNSVWTSTT